MDTVIRCARCWATAQQVSTWRWFNNVQDTVCCLANLDIER